MLYTFQLLADSGSWAMPEPDSVSHATSLDQLRSELEDWADTVGRLDDPSLASVMVWRGRLDTVQDQYPDFVLRLGPRGGIVWEPC
jgi:hypothetical protein